MPTITNVNQAMDQLISQFNAQYIDAPTIEFEKEWPSECYIATAHEGELAPWRPKLRNNCNETMFQRLSEALNTPIHQDIQDFYNRYWSDPIRAKCSEGELSLIQIWNEQDMERLRGNLIGHALLKRKQRRPLTLFFATTEPDGEFFLSIDNQTGDIWLEKPGKAPIRKLADSLVSFLDDVTVLAA